MEKDIIPFEFKRWLYGLPPDMYYLEIGIRILAVFTFLLFILRLLGKRGQKNLSPMQNILMISLGTAVGDVMIMPEVPLFYSLFVLIIVPVLILSLQFVKLKSKKIRDFVNAHAQIIVEDGVLNDEMLKENRLTKEEVYSQLRVQQIRFLEEVEWMIFEPSGEISIFKFDNPKKSDMKTDLLSAFRT